MQRLDYFFLLLLILASAKLSAQVDTTYSPDKTYTQNQLLADFGLLHDVLIEAHPSLYRYQTKVHFDSVLTMARNQTKGPMTEDQFWRVLMPVIVSIRSGHTDLINSQGFMLWHTKNSVNSLPPLFFLNHDSLFISNRYKKNELPVYKAVINVNGRASADLICALRSYTIGNGSDNQFIDFKLNNFGIAQTYGKLYGYSPTYKVELIDNTGAKFDTILKAVPATLASSRTGSIKQYTDDKKNELTEAVSVSYPANLPSTAILKIKSFRYLNYYQSFHQGFFKQLKTDNIQNLVIDLRGNTGGYDAVGLDLMGYLVEGRYTQMESQQIPTNKVTFNDYMMKQTGFDVISPGTSKVENYDYRTIRLADSYSYPENNFRGNLYVLIDKGTFSEAIIFASSLKYQRKLILVGEETGGSEAGSDGGLSIIKLPNTGMVLKIPRYWGNTYSKHQRSKRGLMPDVPVISSLYNREDLVIRKVKELILKK